MNIYVISQETNNNYDTYSEAVVCAPSIEVAKTIHPNGNMLLTEEDWKYYGYLWCSKIEEVKCKFIGCACFGIEQGVVVASFHAG